MNSTTHHSTAAADRIPWSRLIAYGFGGLIPIALCLVAIWLLRFYPLSEKRAYEIKEQLEQRKTSRET